MEVNLTAVQIGALSSVVAEVFKFIPALNQSVLARSLTALAVCFLGTWFFIGFSVANWMQVLLYAFASYKFLVQPLGGAFRVKSQKDISLGGTRG